MAKRAISDMIKLTSVAIGHTPCFGLQKRPPNNSFAMAGLRQARIIAPQVGSMLQTSARRGWLLSPPSATAGVQSSVFWNRWPSHLGRRRGAFLGPVPRGCLRSFSDISGRRGTAFTRPSSRWSLRTPWLQKYRRGGAMGSGMGQQGAIHLILVANVGVFVLWQNQDFRHLKFMNEHFVVSLPNVAQGRLHTLITSSFSHAQLLHLVLNGLMFYFMAPPVLSVLGTTRFLGFFLGASLCTSAAHLAWSLYHSSRSAMRDRWGNVVGYRVTSSGAQGMSGVVLAICVYFAALYPTSTLLLYGIIPVPAWLFAVGIVGLDVYGLMNQHALYGSNVSHAGHLGGAGFGLAMMLLTRRRPPRW